MVGLRTAVFRALLVSNAMILCSLSPVYGEDNRAMTPASEATPGIQVALVQGKLVVTNATQNSPLVLEETIPATLADGMPEDLRSLVSSISKTHGVDPALVAAVMKVESNYNPWARSPKGALGLMQLIPATGERFGVTDFFDPAQNIEGGVRYLKFLSDKFGSENLDLLLAAYNAGENLVAKLGRVPQIRETVDYVRKIKRIYRPEAGHSPFSDPVVQEIEEVSETELPSRPSIMYRAVDERGVIHFSNIGPPN